MFAFAYYNQSNDELTLVRDQLGIKPLYYHFNKNRIIFGSEIKTILLDEEYKIEYDKNALKEHILLGYSLGDKTLFKDIKRLEPGHLIKIKNNKIKKIKYFDPTSLVENIKENKINIDKILFDSVDMHSISDVKIGLMLSGGFDSNLLLNYLKKTNNLDNDFIAYNAGIDSENKLNNNQVALYSERKIAKSISNNYKIKLKKIDVYPEAFMSIKSYIKISEEPICNPSGFLINEICSSAKKSTNKVLLSGHGGDEIFAGYRRHVAAKYIPFLNNFSFLFKLIPLFQKLPNVIYRIIYALKNSDKQIFSLSAIGLKSAESGKFFDKNFITSSDIKNISNLFQKPVKNSKLSLLKKTMLIEFFGYLGSQNLINMDKISMKNSVEVRVPLLNLLLFKKGFSTNDNKLISKFQNKSMIRSLSKKFLSKEIFSLKKSGFGPSLKSLLSSKESVNLLTSEKTKSRGFFNTDYISSKICEDKIDEAEIMQLLNLAFIEQWFRIYIDKNLNK